MVLLGVEPLLGDKQREARVLHAHLLDLAVEELGDPLPDAERRRAQDVAACRRPRASDLASSITERRRRAPLFRGLLGFRVDKQHTRHVVVADELARDDGLRVPRGKVLGLAHRQAQLRLLLQALACRPGGTAPSPTCLMHDFLPASLPSPGVPSPGSADAGHARAASHCTAPRCAFSFSRGQHAYAYDGLVCTVCVLCSGVRAKHHMVAVCKAACAGASQGGARHPRPRRSSL